MRRWFLAALVLAGAVVLAWAPARPRPVQAAQTWQITAGTDIEAEAIELNQYFPHALALNVGDTVTWTLAGFHTVTFNAGQPALPLLVPQPNGDLQLGPAYSPFPPGPTPPGGNYDGSKQIGSGVPQNTDPTAAPPTFSLTFTKPGVYMYECSVHAGMHGILTVLAAGAALPETPVGSSRVDLQACKLEYSIVSPK